MLVVLVPSLTSSPVMTGQMLSSEIEIRPAFTSCSEVKELLQRSLTKAVSLSLHLAIVTVKHI